MGSFHSCFQVEDPGDRLNSFNGNGIENERPSCFLFAFFIKFAVFSANQNHGAVSPASNLTADPDTITSQPRTLPSDLGDHNCREHIDELGSKFTKAQLTEWGSQVAYENESSEDEEVCPTCLEEYTPENPKIVTKCSHHYHLSCIYEWMERSPTCPVCNKEMIFDETT